MLWPAETSMQAGIWARTRHDRADDQRGSTAETARATWQQLSRLAGRCPHRPTGRLVTACQLDRGRDVRNRLQSRNGPVPLLVACMPFARQLGVRVWDVVVETAQLIGSKRQLYPEVHGVCTANVHADAVVAAGPLEGEI